VIGGRKMGSPGSGPPDCSGGEEEGEAVSAESWVVVVLVHQTECACVCVCGGERERERGGGAGHCAMQCSAV
jgi:hypothetical protein